MEEKQFVEDYTIKEIYMNFPFFEEKYYHIINDTQSFSAIEGNEFYSKLKFVKFLKEYKNALDIMPYMHKYSDVMVDKILNEVKYVNTGKIVNHIKYDLEDGKIYFNNNSMENDISNYIIYPLTDIALKDLETIDKTDNKKYKYLDYIRVAYISNKLFNIKNNQEYDIDNSNGDWSQEFKTYDTLIRIFGAETMFNLNSANLPKLKKEFEKYYEEFSMVEDALIYLRKSEYTEKRHNIVLNYLNKMEENINIRKQLIEEKQKPPTFKVQKEIDKFLDILNNDKEVPENIKLQMAKNLYQGAKDLTYEDMSLEKAGTYSSGLKKIRINNGIYYKIFSKEREAAIFHELMHAATTARDKFGITERIGLENKQSGLGLNEGATEYFSKKLYNKLVKIKVPASYLGLVHIVKDLVALYGENVILDDMVNGKENLEKLMEKDGKRYVEFITLTDDFHKYMYSNEKRPLNEVVKKYKSGKETYMKIGNFIEDIKQKRALENPEIIEIKSKWKEYPYYFGVENMFSNIKKIFSRESKNLLPVSSNNPKDKQQEVKSDFRTSLNSENSKIDLEVSSIKQNTNSKARKLHDDER